MVHSREVFTVRILSYPGTFIFLFFFVLLEEWAIAVNGICLRSIVNQARFGLTFGKLSMYVSKGGEKCLFDRT